MSELKSITGPDPDARRNAGFNCMLGDGRITAGICLHDWNALENECVGQNEERGVMRRTLCFRTHTVEGQSNTLQL